MNLENGAFLKGMWNDSFRTRCIGNYGDRSGSFCTLMKGIIEILLISRVGGPADLLQNGPILVRPISITSQIKLDYHTSHT